MKATFFYRFPWVLVLLVLFLLPLGFADAQTSGTGSPGLRIDVSGANEDGDFGLAIQMVIAMTILTLGPSVIMMMTCFTRIVIVLGFVRNAIGVNAAPSSQIIIGLALFLTFFVMGPIWNKIYDDAVTPYMEKSMKSSEALMVATAYMKDFMMNQTRQEDAQFFLEISRQGAMTRDELPLSIVVPSFVLSELRTAFQMGFLIFIPFIIVDFYCRIILDVYGHDDDATRCNIHAFQTFIVCFSRWLVPHCTIIGAEFQYCLKPE